jgi:hypothetical protein
MSGQKDIQSVREACEQDLYTFAQIMFPDRYYGDVHKEFFHWLSSDKNQFQLGLIPRDHQKSHCIAVYCAWKITKKPWWTILYVSSNPGLASEQLGVIKTVLTSPKHRALWPDMLNYVRDRDGELKHKPLDTWTQDAIKVDHPDRTKRQVRDPTVRATSAKSTNTGYHCNEVIFDDLVTDENYESEAEKADVIRCYKNCMKIMTTGSFCKAVGTRYGEDDLYSLITALKIPVFVDGEEVGEEPMWEVFERVVEDSPFRTGDGNFIWPRMQMPDGEWYGFDQRELAIKKRNLTIDGNLSAYLAQYYNDPNDESLSRINKQHFQSIEPKFLKKIGDEWTYNNKKLRLIAAMDLAFSNLKAKRRDFTAIAVVGMDHDGFLYVLDLERFKTDQMEVYYEKAIEMFVKWNFKTLVVETNNGGGLVAEHIKSMIRREGGSLEVKPKAAPNDASKFERIIQILEPRYRNNEVFHNKIGYSRLLEEELMQPKPKNDDLKDAVALAVSELKPPMGKGIALQVKSLGERLSRFGARRGAQRRH